MKKPRTLLPAAGLLALFRGEADHFLERRHEKPAVVVVRPERQSLARAKRLQLAEREVLGEPAGHALPVDLLGRPAARKPVGDVGRAGKQWSGTTSISGKYIKPDWSPPADVKRDKPNIPNLIPGGSPRNPMGAAAMTLSGGEYAIHGTNVPGSIGGFVSYGCIRMFNADVLDLYARASVGTTVVVTR